MKYIFLHFFNLTLGRIRIGIELPYRELYPEFEDGRTFYKCKLNGTDCIQTNARYCLYIDIYHVNTKRKFRYYIPEYLEPEVKRVKRSWGIGKDEKKKPICKLNCVCDPKVKSNIAQSSKVKQESKQEQKVTMSQGLGIGGALAALGALLAIGKIQQSIAHHRGYRYLKNIVKALRPDRREM